MPLQIVREDITKVKADAIVNTANPKPTVGGGTDNAIYEAAGKALLLEERKKIGDIERGEVAVTPAFDLHAKYIIHTVGPVWMDGESGELDTLRSCYRKSLEKAAELGCESIVFPLISTGVYRFPKDQALQIALNEISSFLMRDEVDMIVTLVVFDDKAFMLSKNLFFQVESFIDDEAVIEAHEREYAIDRRPPLNVIPEQLVVKPKENHKKTFSANKVFDEHSFDKELYMSDGKEDSSFLNHLLQLLIEKNLDNKVVYKRANVTKGAFSKILCGDTKIPKKKTVLALCMGMQLSLDEAKDLLASADMAFNPYDKRDQLVMQCIEHGQYNVNQINSMLYICHLPLLGNIE